MCNIFIFIIHDHCILCFHNYILLCLNHLIYDDMSQLELMFDNLTLLPSSLKGKFILGKFYW